MKKPAVTPAFVVVSDPLFRISCRKLVRLPVSRSEAGASVLLRFSLLDGHFALHLYLVGELDRFFGFPFGRQFLGFLEEFSYIAPLVSGSLFPGSLGSRDCVSRS
jgi:hypothetical protein